MEPGMELIDIVDGQAWEELLYRCLVPLPFRRYRKRERYLKEAIRRGLRKHLLLIDGEAVGQVEYAPSAASGYPISGSDLWVMNCIWVLGRSRGRGLDRALLKRMLDSLEGAAGVATISLEGHPSPWFKLGQIEHLGFRSIEARGMRHRVRHSKACFRAHLMWMPLEEGAEKPSMDWKALRRGVEFCVFHPLYRSEDQEIEEIYGEC